MPKLPDEINRFKIVERIAQGGMGALYLAWDPRLERQVAIKLLRDDSDEMRERFSREARFVARLRHPRIVAVFDVGEHDGQPFIAMEYVQGNTLADIVRAQTPLTVGVKLKWIEELCDGLGFAHRAGIVHRDVKPANIIVDAEGSIKILDFGIARDGPGRTQAGMLIGSLNYMSPEQVLGRPVDQRSDVFAVGGVSYELLTYRQAFSGGLDSGILSKILHDAPEPLLSIRPELDTDIARIVDRALEKEPAKRYQDIQSMQRDLLRVLRQFDASETRVDSDLTAVILPPAPLRPSSPARMARREPDRAALERRRLAQIQAQLETARVALSAGNFEIAIAACEQALLLDSRHPIVADLLEQAIVAFDARRAGECLVEAQRRFDAGSLTAALDLVQQAADLGETSAGALRLKDAIEQARADRERERDRLEAGQRAVERARGLFDTGSFEEAVSAAEEALTLLPEDESALELKRRATAAADAAHLERMKERARVATTDARRQFAAGKHEEALHLLEAFVPRPHEDVERTLDELRSTLRVIEQQVEEHLTEASAAVSAHDLDKAATCVREALGLRPSHQRARAMEQQISHAIAEEAERREAGRSVVDRACGLFNAGSFDEAAKAADEALTLLSGDESALAIKQRATAAADAERLERLNERARIATAEARRQFAAGDHEEALHLLEAFVPRSHGDVERTLDELRTMLRAVEQQVEEHLAEAAEAVSVHDLDRAATRVREALALKPADRRARAIDDQISDAKRQEAKQRELEERLERERQQAVAAKLAQAAQTISHEEALVLIHEALELDSVNEEALRSVEIRSAALDEQRAAERRRNEIDSAYRRIEAMLATEDPDAVEEALGIAEDREDARKALQPLRRQLASKRRDIARRELATIRQREREQAIADALDRADRAVSHEVAVAAYRQVLDLDSGHQLAQMGLNARQAAMEKERLISAALDRAAAAASDSEAVIALREVLELEPDLPDVTRQLQEREAAIRIQEEQARQRRHDDAIAARIAKAATTPSNAAALVQLGEILELYPENAEARRLYDLRALALKAEQGAEDQRCESDAGEKQAPQADREAPAIPLRVGPPDEVIPTPASLADLINGWLSFGNTVLPRSYIGGAVAAVIVAIVVSLAYRSSVSSSVGADAANPAPSPPPQSGPVDSVTPPPIDEPAAPSPTVEVDAPPAPVDPAVELENRLGPIRVLARRQLQQGNPREALGTIMAGLKLQSDDVVLRRMLVDMAQDAIVAARAARDSVVSAGAESENVPRYRDGRMKEQEGLRLAPRRPEMALHALWDAANLYSQAIEDLRKAKPQQPLPTVPSPVQPQPQPQRPAPVESPPVVQPAAPVASTAADEAAIRAVLRGYEQAYAALSVQDVQRVYPGINADALANNFKRMRALSVEIIDPHISIAASTATVVCQVRQRFTPDVGSGGQTTVNATFRLVKRSNAWVIVERR